MTRSAPPCAAPDDDDDNDDDPDGVARRQTDVPLLDRDALETLAAIDDCIGGHVPATGEPGALPGEITPAIADLIDTILVVRMAAEPDGGPHSPPSIGKFRVIRGIGTGGFAEVYEAIDTKLVRRVALKITRPETLADEAKSKRFLREGRHAARVIHPHVVVIHEVGEHGGLPYIAQELCGESLASWLDRHPGPLTPRIAVRVMKALAEAAHAAHSVGVLHRDIKPGNVLLVPGDGGPLPPDDRPGSAPQDTTGQDVKLGDFGLSRSIFNPDGESSTGATTEIGTTLGTPEWMAPEQVKAEIGPADVRTDVHALGLVLYRLLTGRSANDTPTRDGIYRRILEVEAEPVDRLVPGIHPDLVAVTGKCLAKLPTDRYQSAAELGVDLARFLDGRPTIARPLTTFGRVLRWLRRHPTLVSAILATVAAIALGGMVIRERVRFIAREKVVQKTILDNAAKEAHERAERARRTAARDLRRAFETYHSGNAAGAVDDLRRSAAADPALADSLAGGWLLGRTHGEVALLVDRVPATLPADRTAPQIHSIALSIDGDRLAAGAADGTLILVPLASDGTAAGAAIEIDTGHEINQVAFSPDGRIVATAGKWIAARSDDDNAEEGCVRLWRVADGRPLRDVAADGKEVFSVAFSPDGNRLAWGGVDRVVRVDDVAAGEEGTRPVELRPFERPGVVPHADSDIEMLRFLDGTRLLVAIDDRVCLVDLAGGGIDGVFRGDLGHVQTLTLSPDGRRLMAGGWHENMVRVWDIETGILQLELESHPQWVNGCGFSPDGSQIVTGCKDGTIRVFDATTGDLLLDIIGHIGRIWCTAFHPSGRIVSAGGDGTVRLWDPSDGPSVLGAKPIGIPGVENVISTADLGGGRWLITPRTGAPVIVDAGRLESTTIDVGHGNEILAAAVDRSRGRTAFATVQGLAVHRLPGADQPNEVLLAEDGKLNSSVAFCPDGWLYQGEVDTASSRSRLLVWPAGLDAPRCLEDELAAWITSIAITERPTPRMAFATGSIVRIHDLHPDGGPLAGCGRQLADLSGEFPANVTLAWSPDGDRLAVGGGNGRAGILDARTGWVAVDLAPFSNVVRGIVWAHNGSSLIVADERRIRLCDAVSGATLDEIRPDWAINHITLVEGHDGGQKLAVTGNRSTLFRRRFGAKRRQDTPADGRLLVLDLGRRLPAPAAADAFDGQ